MINKTLGIMIFCVTFLLPFYVYPSIFSLFNEEEDSKSRKVKEEDFELQEIINLQERCDKLCKNFYKHFDSKRVQIYQNYYNEKLNKCFVVISNKKNTEKYLFEVDDNEMKIHGIFIQVGNDVEFCLVSNKGCKSETEETAVVKSHAKCKFKKEWDSLVKHYMEE